MSTWGNTIPQSELVGRPHNSPLIKLPIRPAPNARGASGAIKSVTSKKGRLILRAYNQVATKTPISPP
ncbi:hypothetical protein THIOM_003413 [Candidatus Thiomargarita nelsonii]|uniref:Uncharacterized protein n=1 Tax=Candidatus Thiomargarita nelsonii TaxID=1003181 RepID=A0A176RYU2_9GAMM|nr:hypothetical protein THIOM_003413 [Candidatus Thiomargarita nelsonii]